MTVEVEMTGAVDAAPKWFTYERCGFSDQLLYEFEWQEENMEPPPRWGLDPDEMDWLAEDGKCPMIHLNINLRTMLTNGRSIGNLLRDEKLGSR